MSSGFRFFLKTYGCQMNEHDSSRISSALSQKGMQEVNCIDEANVVILNTCHIREKARHKVLTELGRIKAHKTKSEAIGEQVIIAVGGCVAQAEGEDLIKAAPFVDIVFGTQSFYKLSTMIEQIASSNRKLSPMFVMKDAKTNCSSQGKTKIVDILLADENKFQFLPAFDVTKSSAFLAIQEGCNKFCTYCVVPNTRGREVSRDVASILQEVRLMIQHGVKEITLLGQNVNSYKYDDGYRIWTFADLIRSVCAIDGVRRVFYTSSHPLDVSIDIIKAHAEIPQLMPFWHLPVQSGSDRILKAMNRKYSVDDYKRTIDIIRKYNTNIAMCSDFIVGFPGETDSDFIETLNLVNYVNYAQAFSFKYSPRPRTVASDMSNQVDDKTKIERLHILQEQLRAKQSLFNSRCVGSTLSVLFQKYGKDSNQVLGKSQFMQSVVVETTAPALFLDTIQDVLIKKSTSNSLSGNIS
ncbi:MAG: tRNA (N6-isopentenyl adenosine(37)-C2)-methylthiotransferase MiaB [Holosporales bacterium]|nr:tRNA (N6-isopentenyl adenosine(37)-C2)-methylthiotransferase MiaB [Holosporales bacterium]